MSVNLFINSNVYPLATTSESAGEIKKDQSANLQSIPSDEKTLWEKEKDILKLTAIDVIASGVSWLIVYPYLRPPIFDPALSRSYPVINLARKGDFIATGFVARQVHLLSAEAIKKCLGTKSFAAKFFLKINGMIQDYLPVYCTAMNRHSIVNLAHEYGHYFAYKYFDSSIKAEIYVDPYHRGAFTRTPRPLDLPHQEAIMYAAGPVVEMALYLSMIATAHFQKGDSYFKKNLDSTAAVGILNALGYAYMGLDSSNNNTGDYGMLWKKGGIHPYASMATIVALPAILKAGLMCYDYYAKQKETSVEKVESVKAESAPVSLS